MTFSEKSGRVFDRVLDACAWIGCAMLAFQVGLFAEKFTSGYHVEFSPGFDVHHLLQDEVAQAELFLQFGAVNLERRHRHSLTMRAVLM